MNDEKEKLMKMKKRSIGADRMTDLIRGTMLVVPDAFLEAYKHLCSCKQIKVIRIKNKLRELGMLTVNFIFNDECIGEM